MKKKCIAGAILVITISLVSVAAFAYTVTAASKIYPVDQDSLDTEFDEITIIPVRTSEIEASTIDENQCETEYQDEEHDENYMLAKIAMAEAEGEDTEGKALVMRVVLNRVESQNFPDSIEGVIFQKNQFSPIRNGRYDSVEPDEDCYRALELVQGGWDESLGATYFESKSNSTWHSEHLEFLFRHGKHYFYKE